MKTGAASGYRQKCVSNTPVERSIGRNSDRISHSGHHLLEAHLYSGYLEGDLIKVSANASAVSSFNLPLLAELRGQLLQNIA